MARLRYNGLTATLGAALTSSDTTITLAAALTSAAGAVPTITGTDYIPLTILDATGGVSEIVYLTAYTSGATTGTITRAQESTTAAAHASGDAAVHAPTALDIAVGIVAYKSYSPGTLAAYTTTSTSLVDVDATNMSVTFIAPGSGTVLVRMTGLGGLGGSGSDNYSWGIREGTTTVSAAVQIGGVLAGSGNLMSSAAAVISGLTPGSVHTYKWAWLSSVGTATVRLYAGGVAGGATMEVHALP